MAKASGIGGTKMPISKSQKRKYLAAGGSRCLFCESHDLEVLGQADSDDSATRHLVHCYGCGKKWIDVHDLVDVEEIE